jgi:mRNA interferase MazF
MTTKPGEVYMVDLGYVGKVKPMLVVSRDDANPPRALSICVPITTAHRGSSYEVALPKAAFLHQQSYANTQGIIAIEHHDLSRRIGRFPSIVMDDVKKALRHAMDL